MPNPFAFMANFPKKFSRPRFSTRFSSSREVARVASQTIMVALESQDFQSGADHT